MELRTKKRLYFGTNEIESCYQLNEADTQKAKAYYIYPDNLTFGSNPIDPFNKANKELHGKYFLQYYGSILDSYLLKYCYFCNCFMLIGMASEQDYENSQRTVIVDEASSQHCLHTTCKRFTSQNFCKFCERENG